MLWKKTCKEFKQEIDKSYKNHEQKLENELFVVWFIHWKRMIRPFLFIDKQKRKLSIHELVVDFWLANVAKLDDQNRFMQH
jgi:capsule polysaccharide export protein KpsC/LpsZ